MADAPPGTPDSVSSYSDPLYDRMEGTVNQLKRRWWIIALIAICSAIGVVVVKEMASATPEAASSYAFIEARGDRASLEAVLGDEAVSPEFRARAGISAAALALADGDTEAAESLLDRSSRHATAAGLQELQLTITLSRAAIDEQAGELAAAREHYAKALVPANRSDHTALYAVAALGAARVDLGRAEASEDRAEAMRLRRAAYDQLEYLISATPSNVRGASDIAATARYLRADLDRRFPDLLQEEEEAADDFSAVTGTDVAESDAGGDQAGPVEDDDTQAAAEDGSPEE